MKMYKRELHLFFYGSQNKELGKLKNAIGRSKDKKSRTNKNNNNNKNNSNARTFAIITFVCTRVIKKHCVDSKKNLIKDTNIAGPMKIDRHGMEWMDSFASHHFSIP